MILLSWSTAALGFRPAAVVHASKFSIHGRVRIGSVHVIPAAASVGVALADMLVVTIGVGLVALMQGVRHRSVGELGLLLFSSSALGLAVSLQFEIARLFGTRAVVLVATALLALVTIHAAHADLPPPAALLGRLVFPVSGLASATEEPLRLDLAARALMAGVTYDLALIALLLALPGNRARGQQ